MYRLLFQDLKGQVHSVPQTCKIVLCYNNATHYVI